MAPQSDITRTPSRKSKTASTATLTHDHTHPPGLRPPTMTPAHSPTANMTPVMTRTSPRGHPALMTSRIAHTPTAHPPHPRSSTARENQPLTSARLPQSVSSAPRSCACARSRRWNSGSERDVRQSMHSSTGCGGADNAGCR